MAAPPTILDLKLSFLRSQIQALSQPLSLPPNYQPASEEDALRQTAIDAALLKLNESIKKHSKLVYSGQAQRHVAEQIDRLYWQAGERDVDTREGLERGADLSLEKNIERLHDSWDGDEEEDEAAARARYEELTETLKDLDGRRKAAREKVEGYKRLRDMLAPFAAATETVQPNLVARDGELERELERMRLLLARVRGRVEALPEGVTAEEEMDVDLPDEGEKVAALF